MKITVIIPSRGRTRGLSAVLYSLRYLESGENQVTYCVACDDDDIATIVFCQEIKEVMPLAIRIGERQETMGAAINDVAKFWPADVYCVINDDILITSVDWDKAIAKGVKETPYGVFFWKNAAPMDALYPIVSEKWRIAAGGIFSEHYPFWYDDLCLVELWVMATQQEVLRLDIYIVDKPIKTQRMRDLKFWQSVYTKTRKARVDQSIDIAYQLNLPKPTIGEALADKLTKALVAMSDEYLAQIEINQGEPTPPDKAYLKAKDRAQTMLDNIENLEMTA